MKTIYEHLIDKNEKTADRLTNLEFDALIRPRLNDLLYKSCGINLADTGLGFSPYMTISGENISVVYKFLYGTALIAIRKNLLSLNFTFTSNKLGNHKIPLNAEKCFVKVDHDLNFKQASFNHYANFSKLTIDRTDDGSVHSSVNINRIIDSSLNNTNTVSYLNGKIGGCYIDMHPFGLKDLFFKANDEFDQLLVRVMIFCEHDPHSFYGLFPEYPSYLDFMTNIDKATEFLNLFHTQYMDDAELLASKLLLLDMQVI